MFSAAISSVVLLAAAAATSENDLPDAKPVPDVQVVPLPNNEASFQHFGRELTLNSSGQSTKNRYSASRPAGSITAAR